MYLELQASQVCGLTEGLLGCLEEVEVVRQGSKTRLGVKRDQTAWVKRDFFGVSTVPLLCLVDVLTAAYCST